VRVEGAAESGRLVARIDAADGAFPEQPAERSINLVLHRSPEPVSVVLAGKGAAPAWRYDGAGRRVEIDLTCPTTEPTELSVEF
jgi:hypothetical protein